MSEPTTSGLTPLKIRGKKRRHANQQVAKTQSLGSGGSTTPSEQETRKIPGKSAYSGCLSTLELLPKEILELIFKFTVNPNLPRASYVIARKLSGQSILDWHCRRIFRTFEYELHARSTQRYVVLDACIGENWHQLVKARTYTLQHSRISCDYFIDLLDTLLNEEKERLSRQFEAADKQNQVTWSEQGDLRIGHVDPLLDVKAPSQLNQVVATLKISLDFTCNIPGTLLKYPLSSDSTRLLDFLVRSGAQVDWQNSFDGERAHEAWNGAVRARDYRLVHRFMGPGINVRPTEEDLYECLESLDWDAAMFKLIAISFNTSKAYYSHKVVSRRLPWPIEGYGGFEELGISGVRASFESEHPQVCMKTLSRNPPGSSGRQLLDDYSNRSLIKVWGGAMCSASILKDYARLCYCRNSAGTSPNTGAWHEIKDSKHLEEDIAMEG